MVTGDHPDVAESVGAALGVDRILSERAPGEKVEAVEGIAGASVEVVWDPPWHPGMMTEEAQLELGMIY